MHVQQPRCCDSAELVQKSLLAPALKQHQNPWKAKNTGAAPDVPAGPQALGDRIGARPRLLDEVGGVHKLAPHARLHQVCASTFLILAQREKGLALAQYTHRSCTRGCLSAKYMPSLCLETSE